MFVPRRIIFLKDSLDFKTGQEILAKFQDNPDIEILNITNNKLKILIPGNDLSSKYKEGKKTLVVTVKKSLKFQTCKPSANYQLPLVSGCAGQCEYCYLNTMLGDKPFTKVYVNVEDILNQAQKYTDERLPQKTIFEGSATSDPIPLEPYTHSLKKCIEYFGKSDNARFRFVTKYNDVDSLLNLKHNGHTEIRFTINTPTIIDKYEHYTASSDKRIEASIKVAKAGYPIGFVIAPVFLYPNWQKEYHDLLLYLSNNLPQDLKYPIIFEVISHRYTTVAKNRIHQIFPKTELPMNDEERKFKFGQFGYGKYMYQKESLDEMKEFFKREINELFPHNDIKYII